ncbi:MAG: Gfo/Idh/MocA family oxidoreductase [Candidatus Poribacteria bacterium]|nr:Gfo/Idh/MocA family oxidoreductase [Candidatus Poribacteria bacterium]
MAAIRVGVIGAGNIAQFHLPVLKALSDVEIIALCDNDTATLNATSDRFQIANCITSYQELLDDGTLDAVFVLVSVLNVAEITEPFLKASIPTFLEKPPGLYSTDTQRLAAIAAENNCISMVGLNRRFYSTLVKGREWLMEGDGVSSVTVDAHEDISRIWEAGKHPEAVVRRWSYANGIHALDLLRFFGGDVAHVHAIQKRYDNPMPDSYSALIEFENGAVGRALMDWSAPGTHRVQARAPGMTLTTDSSYRRVILQRRGKEDIAATFSEVDNLYKPGFYAQDEYFISCVRQKKSPEFPAVTLGDSVKTMQLIDAITGMD